MPTTISGSPVLTPAGDIEFNNGTLSNVVELDASGQPAIGWCFVPDRALAAGDVMLAQKIALETDEAAVLALAHRFFPRLPSLPRVVRRAY